MKILKNSLLGIKEFSIGSRVRVVRDRHNTSQYGEEGTITDIEVCEFSVDGKGCPDKWDKIAGCPGYMNINFDNRLGSNNNAYCHGYHDKFALEAI